MTRQTIAAALLAAAGVAWFASRPPSPGPDAPPAPAGLVLEWVGPTAAADRATMGWLCAGLADAIEHDGTLTAPRITTGTQVEELRVAAREGRMRGESIGARQPAARQAIGDYLDREAGKSGGPLDADGRQRWVKAFRGVAAAGGVRLPSGEIR
jgi:hypothetical protein